MTASGAIQRKALLTAMLGGSRSVERVEIKQIELAPGQATGLHRHPCPVLGYVAAGLIEFQIDGEAAQRLRQGDAFFEPDNARILRFDNASASEPAVFIAFYLLGTGEHEPIEMLA